MESSNSTQRQFEASNNMMNINNGQSSNGSKSAVVVVAVVAADGKKYHKNVIEETMKLPWNLEKKNNYFKKHEVDVERNK